MAFPPSLVTDLSLLSRSLEFLERLRFLPLRWPLCGFALFTFNRLILCPQEPKGWEGGAHVFFPSVSSIDGQYIGQRTRG